jgi:hypothetical protein
MLKRSKPLLAAKYISECDLIVYDVHSGNPEDAILALKALNKHIPVDDDAGGDEKVLVLISSLMAWDATPRKLEKLVQPGTEDPEDIAEAVKPAGDDAENEGAGSQSGSQKAAEEDPIAEAKADSVKDGEEGAGSAAGS